MPYHRAGQLARETPVVRPGDPLGLVAENLRESQYDAIPVVEGDLDAEGKLGPNARVLGIIFEHDLSRAVMPVLEQRETARLASVNGDYGANGNGADAPAFVPAFNGANGHPGNGHPFAAAPIPSPTQPSNGFPGGVAYGPMQRESAIISDVTLLTARAVMHENVPIVPSLFSLHNALLTLDRYEAPALPVTDEMGNYRGMISRADVVAALGGYVRPPVVGGMATPLGVWLTTGYISGGAPPLGLFLSGAVMGAGLMLAHYLLFFAFLTYNQEWARMFQSGRLGMASDSTNFFNLIVTGLEGFLFLIILRAMPLAGIHAAEHQTVWAIEKGVPLEPEYVRKMPRAHPRCGTNLMALGGLIEIVISHLPEVSPGYVLAALLFVYFTWRRFGTALQEYFTTKPATLKQLESGIRAGKEVLQKYQEQPHMLTSFGSRMFNSGLLLSAAGIILVQLLVSWLGDTWTARFLGG